MFKRKDPFVTDNIYHTFNKTIEHKRIFESYEIASKFLEIIRYYRSSSIHMKFSHFEKLSPILKKMYEEKLLNESTFRVNILSFCIMPTHFHLLLKQIENNGVSFYLSQIQNSLTRYFNIKYNRMGPLFVQTFKSVLIKTEDQLKHVSRYIHLNPYSSAIISSSELLENYPWSSFHEYLNKHSSRLDLTQPKYILNLFNNNKKRYKTFVLSNAQHQKTLEYCKYSARWNANSPTFKVEQL